MAEVQSHPNNETVGGKPLENVASVAPVSEQPSAEISTSTVAAETQADGVKTTENSAEAMQKQIDQMQKVMTELIKANVSLNERLSQVTQGQLALANAVTDMLNHLPQALYASQSGRELASVFDNLRNAVLSRYDIDMKNIQKP